VKAQWVLLAAAVAAGACGGATGPSEVRDGRPLAHLVADLDPGRFSSNPQDLVAVDGTLFFTATRLVAQRGLWKTDGLHTVLVRAFDSVELKPRAAFGGRLLLTGRDPRILWEEDDLWVSDGTAAGTSVLRTTSPRPGGPPDDFTAGAQGVFFTSRGPLGETRLWITDATAAGTHPVKDLGPEAATIRWLAYSDAARALYFFASPSRTVARPNPPVTLYRTDGTESGTVRVIDIQPRGAYFGDPTKPVAVGTRLFFDANSQHWVSDGTTAGTRPIAEVAAPAAAASGPATKELLHFFVDFSGTGGYELWRTDGTASGTAMVRDICPGRCSSFPREGAALGSRLLMRASGAEQDEELWRTDGSESGTVLVRDIRPGPQGSYPSKLRAWRGRVFFHADDGMTGHELWQTDGTEAGTAIVKDIAAGPAAGIDEGAPVVVPSGERVYFVANDRVYGRELWAFGPAPPPTPLPTATPAPSGPNQPPEITRVIADEYSHSENALYFTPVDPDGDLMRWTATLSRGNDPGALGGLRHTDADTGVVQSGTVLEGLARSGQRVLIVYGGRRVNFPGPYVIVTLEVHDLRGAAAVPQDARVYMPF